MMRMLAAVRATLTTVTILAGSAALLLALGGNPVPRGVPSAEQFQSWLDEPLRPQYMPATVRCAAWLIWALIATTALAIALLRARRWQWARLAAYLPGPVQGLAATLLGAATVTTAVGVAPAQGAAPVSASNGLSTETATAMNTNTSTNAAPDSTQQPTGEPRTTTVRRGDTLWNIAADELGDPDRWRQIYRLNTGRYPTMDGGDHIEPGWTLHLPTRATAHSHHRQQPPTEAPPSSRPAGSPHAGQTSPAPSTTTTSAATPTHSDAARPATTTTADNHREAGNGPEPEHRRTTDGGVTLASGSWIDLGLAAAIAAAAVLVWAHRRRRYRPRPLSADLRQTDPDLAPLPPVVNQIRRLRRGTAGVPDQTDHTALEELTSATGPAPGDEDSTPEDTALISHTPTIVRTGADPAQDEHEEQNGTRREDPPRPAVPSLQHPLSAVWPPAGLGLTGPGAESAARGFLTAALAAGSAITPADRSWVVIPSPVTETLLGTGAVALPRMPRLTVTAGLDESLDLLEAQILLRSRLVYAHEVDTVAELRATNIVDEPLPPMMLLADAANRHQRTRIAALLIQGQRLDIHGVLLGAWPDGDTLGVAEDGTTTPADGEGPRHSAHPADLGRLAVLTPTETSDLLRTVAESHTGQPPVPAPVEAGTPSTTAASCPPPATIRHGSEVMNNTSDETSIEGHRRGAVPESEEPDRQHDDTQPVAGASGQPTPADGPDPSVTEPDTAETPSRVKISVLGPPTITGLPPGITPRKKSLELLVYLAVHDGEASTEAILDDVLGDAPTSKAAGRLYTYVSDLRNVLRRTAGSGTYLTHPGHRYALNRDLVDIDLWRMRDAIRDATHTTDLDERRAGLRRAADTYSGLLADGADYDWIEPYREAIRQQVLDTYLALAETLTDNPAEQIKVLDTAIRYNPYTEQLYQQAMTTRAALGHRDAIRTLRRTLSRALAEIDAAPSDDTIALADRLIAQAQRTDVPQPQQPPTGADK